MQDTKKINILINATLEKLSTVENISNWVDLDRAIGQLGTIAGLIADDANMMAKVVDILKKLSDDPHHNQITIRSFAIVLDNIMAKNSKHIPMGMGMIEKMVKNPENKQNSLATLYQTLGNNFALMLPDDRNRTLAVLTGAPWHPGATPLSISIANGAVPSFWMNVSNKMSER